MFNVVKEILQSFQEYYGNEHLLVILLFCFMLAYLFFPNLKQIIIYPTLLIVLLLMNPVLYIVIFSKIMYWRLLWMIPGTFLIAYVFCRLVKTGKTLNNKMVILCFLCFLIVFSGNYVYNNEDFKQTQNLEKLNEGVRKVGAIILEENDHPKCLLHAKYLSQIRQYSADIELLYGRDAYNYITVASDEFKLMADEMEKKEPDYDFIVERFKAYQCDIMVVRAKAPIPKYLLKEHHMHEIAREDNSIIYKAVY